MRWILAAILGTRWILVGREGRTTRVHATGMFVVGEKKRSGRRDRSPTTRAKLLSRKYRSFWFWVRLSEGVDRRWVKDFSSNRYFLIPSLLYSIDNLDKFEMFKYLILLEQME
jgi:hypothetical protein